MSNQEAFDRLNLLIERQGPLATRGQLLDGMSPEVQERLGASPDTHDYAVRELSVVDGLTETETPNVTYGGHTITGELAVKAYRSGAAELSADGSNLLLYIGLGFQLPEGLPRSEPGAHKVEGLYLFDEHQPGQLDSFFNRLNDMFLADAAHLERLEAAHEQTGRRDLSADELSALGVPPNPIPDDEIAAFRLPILHQQVYHTMPPGDTPVVQLHTRTSRSGIIRQFKSHPDITAPTALLDETSSEVIVQRHHFPDIINWLINKADPMDGLL